MKVPLSLILVLFVAILIQTCLATPQKSYTHCKWLKGSPTNYRFYWSINATHINAAIEAYTKGWIGLGISTDGSMTSEFKGSDMIVGFVDNDGAGHVYDYWTTARAVPEKDPPSSQDVILTASKQTVAGLTTIEFSRLLNTKNPDDRIFKTDGSNMYIIWAVGDQIPDLSGVAFGKHSKAGASFVSLTTPSICPSSPPTSTDSPIVHQWKSESGDFSMQWAVTEHSWLDVTLIGRTRGWIGLGFSDTNSMFYSDMIVGWVGDQDNITHIYDMYSADKRALPSLDSSLGGQNNVQTISGIQTRTANGEHTTTLKFKRPLITSDNYDLDIADRDIFILWALGDVDGSPDGPRFTKHSQKGIVRMNLKEGSINTTTESWIEDPRTRLRSGHGALMVLGWCVFITLGTFVARFLRPKTFIWWHIHVTCQVLGLLCISIALGFILKAIGTGGEHFGNFHAVLGTVLVLGAFIQTALGAMAHFLRTTNSPVFPNQVHWWLGRIIWLAALFNVLLGLRQYQIAPLTREGGSFWGIYITWLVVVVFGSYLFATFSEWTENRAQIQQKAKAQAESEADPYDIYTSSHYDVTLIDELERVEAPPPGIVESIMGNKILTGSFTLHLGLGLALAFLFLTLPLTKPSEPYHYCPNCTEITFAFDKFNLPIGVHPSSFAPLSTSFICKAFDFGVSDTYHIVEIHPSATSGYATHMRLLHVPYDLTQGGKVTLGNDGHFPCLEALEEASPIYGWSVGMGSFTLPPEAGIRVGRNSDIRYVVLQIHYENPNLLQNVFDSSGVVMKVTTTLRPHDAGVLAVGVTPSTISIPPQRKEYEIAGICSADKTSNLPAQLNIFASSSYARYYGRLSWCERWTPQGPSKKLTLHSVLGHSYSETSYEPTVMMSYIDSQFNPGDSLRTHCIYDTTSTNTTVVGGSGIDEEMCWTYLSYWPKMDAQKCFSSAQPVEPNDGHFRPDRNSTSSI